MIAVARSGSMLSTACSASIAPRSSTTCCSDGDVREYGVADGLLGVESVKRHRILVTDSIGRVWFALSRGLSVADPTRADDRGQPAITLVEQMTADGARSTSTVRSGFRPVVVASRSRTPV